jgi:hypothetical protein
MGIRRDTNKEKVLGELRRMPIVTVACKRSNISTATYYRWRYEDAQFEDDSDEAIRQGSLIVNDMVESQLLKGINEGVPMLIMYYLNNRHPNYRNNKVWQVQANADNDKEQYYNELQKIRNKIGAFLDEPDDSGFKDESG